MIERAGRATLHRVLQRVRAGQLELVEAWSGEQLGFDPAEAGRRPRSRSTRRASTRSSRAAASGSARRTPTASGIPTTSSPCSGSARSSCAAPTLRGVGSRRSSTPAQRLAKLPLLNTRGGARHNIAAHYDLGNELFELFLDREPMMYSMRLVRARGRDARAGAGGEARGGSAAGSTAPRRPSARDRRRVGRARHVHRGVELRLPGDDDDDFARAARVRRARVAAAGLERQVEVLGVDYRDLRGNYDKLVSIEMIEAVGWEYFDCSSAAARSCCARTVYSSSRRSASTTAPTPPKGKYMHVRDRADLSRRCLPSLEVIGAAWCTTPTCARCGSTTSAPATRSPCGTGGSGSGRRGRARAHRLRPPLPPHLGDVSGDLRGRLPRGADRRPPDPVREARVARRARAVRRRRRPSGSGRRRSDPVARQRLLHLASA